MVSQLLTTCLRFVKPEDFSAVTACPCHATLAKHQKALDVHLVLNAFYQFHRQYDLISM